MAPLEVAEAASTYDLRVRVTGGARPDRRERSGTASLARSSRRIPRFGSRSSGKASSRATRASSSARRRACTKRARRLSSRSDSFRRRARRFFGTDGVRGIVGDELTPELVERIGKAATLWAGGGRVLVGRDTRGSGPELEQAVARGIASAGGTAVLGGVLPTPAVALLADDLGVVVSASHNPPEYNGVKLFRPRGAKASPTRLRRRIEALFEAPAPRQQAARSRTA